MNCVYVELLKAYKITFPTEKDEDVEELLVDVSKTSKCYDIIKKAIKSTRHPKEILEFSKGIGMYIPHTYRHGIHAYNYFIDNVVYYDDIIDISLDVNFAKTTDDILLYLSFFSDFEIMKNFDCKTFTSRCDLLNIISEKLISSTS